MPITTKKLSGAFPEIAIIRKGGPKQKTMKNGREIEVLGRDLGDSFRVVFQPGAEDAEAGFVQEYGGLQVKAIHAMLPFRCALESWDAWNEAYSAGRLVARTDGEKYIVKRHPLTGEYEVQDGEPFTPWKPGDVITYNNNGRDYALKFKAHGRLKLFLPYTLKEGSTRLVHFTLKTTSFYDCIQIEQYLMSIQAIADALNGGNAAGIPIVIYRKLTNISRTTETGGAVRDNKWLVAIEVDPVWMAQNMKRYQALASGQVPALPTGPVDLTIPAGAVIDDDDESDPELDGDTIDAKYTSEAEPQEPPAPEYDGRTPEKIKMAIKQTAKQYAGKKISDGKRGVLVPVIESIFAGPAADSARHQLQKFLTGKASLRDIPDEYLIAIYLWLEPRQDSGGAWVSSDESAQEARAIIRALDAAGQMSLL